MATTAFALSPPPPSMPISALRSNSRALAARASASASAGKKRSRVRAFGDFSHFADAVKKDASFLRKRIGRGIEWANEALRIPLVAKTLDDVVWLRVLENPDAPPVEDCPWPRPCYPELSGLDLVMADLRALEAYMAYFYCLSRVWSRPLPEVYNVEDVNYYFSCRPHVVALRLLEVFFSFASATVKIRASGIASYLRLNSDKDNDGNISQYNFGLALKETMLNLGPTFIKVGQSLSTRPDIIGSEISKALSELHDQIPPFPRTVAMQTIKEEFGSPAQSIFSHISEDPVAAASFGQVYRGKTLDGLDVAIKVQRPNLRHVVVRDIYILRLALGLVQKIAKRKSDLRLYADELGKGLVGELDYTLEASNAAEFSETHSHFTFMRVPKVLEHLSRKRVLTMEWMVGESPTDLLEVSTSNAMVGGCAYSEEQIFDAKRRLLDLVSKGVESTLVQLLETGLLHADPHPGNLRYTSTGQIGFLDFGLLCQMERRHQLAMLASIVHIVNGDWASLIQALTEMDVVRPGTNLWRVTMDLEDALGEVEFTDGIPDVKFSRVLGKIWSVALKYHFRMPPYYTLVLRSLASFEGLAVAADPNFKTFQAAYPYVVRKLLTENTAATRKILHSVVFTKKKEFQWERLSLFLKVGVTRKSMQGSRALNDDASLDIIPNRNTSAFDVANLVLRLLPSKQGVVLRRLLMTADGASLIRAMVSKEGGFFRQQLCGIIAEILYHWMLGAIGSSTRVAQYNSRVKLASGTSNYELGPSSGRSTSIYDYQSIFRDRRLRVIFSKALRSAQSDPVLMLRFCWSSLVIFVTASALACHRAVVNLSEAYLGPLSFVPKRFAIST
ncbi:uncharacterized protein slr1919 isoform X1 [Eucalyptus grandis]|uniref:uncharacterized protein slr1919 isoform X1 n=1 Tax=Eucalyptus grandis TaxID=71139 RepID=UPI00192EFBD0|nr:uncharacterized protein slr1919 isoform X1 [Eucalyptus grandis]